MIEFTLNGETVRTDEDPNTEFRAEIQGFFYVFVDFFVVFLQKTRFLQRKAKIFNFLWKKRTFLAKNR